MTFAWSCLLDKRGGKVKKSVPYRGVIFDLDKNRTATLFDGSALIGTLHVLEIEAHANGIFLRGVERETHGRVQYQEWFLAYETANS